MNDKLTPEEKQTLLHIARQSLELAVRGEKLPPLDEATLTPCLREIGASFVTLTVRGDLRGCIGALEPYQPLAMDVREHAIAAALEDPRFPPVQPKELNQIEIEVSRLTVPRRLEYKDADDLLAKLNPNVDGVILRMAGIVRHSCRRCGRRFPIKPSSSMNCVTRWAPRRTHGGINIWRC